MLNRIIRIAAAVCTLCLAGCAARLGPADNSDEAIRFTAGSLLLRDDDTKGGVIKTEFVDNDQFYVYGTKNTSGVFSTVFNGTAVTLNGTSWDYSPLRFWDSNASYYDFMAVTGPSSISHTNPLTITVGYNSVDTQYDLMAASHTRPASNTSVVDFLFHHMLSAVDVTVYNDSPVLDITLLSYGFRHIFTYGSLTVEAQGDSPNVSWNPQSDATNTILGSNPEPDASLSHVSNGISSFYPTTAITDLMVPQSLEVHGTAVPSLVLEYQYLDGTDPVTVSSVITLSEIKMFGTDQYITEWVPGTRYHYELHIRMGGGIRIHVTTSPWEVVNAETPGLTI